MPAMYPADHWLSDVEDADSPIIVLRTGYLRLLRYAADGRRLITGIAGPGAIVGEIPPGRGRYGVETITDVSLCTFDCHAFEHLLRDDAEVLRCFRTERGRNLAALRQHIWMRGLQTPEQRLAAFLVQACGMLPYQPIPRGGGVLTLDIPRADIADLISTTRETISRLTRRWLDQGLIAIPDSRHLVLRDRARLALRGGLDPGALCDEPDCPPDVVPPPQAPPQARLHARPGAPRGATPACRPARLHYL